MEIKFIGVGAAFETENFQNNHLITKNGKHLLLIADGFRGFVKQGAIFSERYGMQCN